MAFSSEALEQHGAFVRALARRLVRDAETADDVAQDAWLEALRRERAAASAGGAAPERASPRPIANARAWLARVVTRSAGRSRRGHARRSERERAAARAERTPSAADVAAQREMLARLVAAVLALDEPYQSLVIARYYDGASAAAIAEREGVPLATVKSRLQRALELLRARLDGESGGRRDTWCHALAPIVGETVRGALAPIAGAAGQATSASAGASAGVAWTGLGGGWLAMSTAKGIAAVAVAGALALAAWWQLGGATSGAPLAPTREAIDVAPLQEDDAPAAAAVDERAPARAPSEPAAEPSRARPAFPPAPASDVGTLELLVRWHDGTPAAEIAAHVMPWGASDAFLMKREVTTDANGACTIDQLAPGKVGVYLDRADGGTAVIQAGATTALELTLAEGFTVRGRVLDASGEPVAGARVMLSDYGNHGGGRRVGTSDAHGRFEVRGLEDGHSLSAHAAGHVPSLQTPVAAAVGARVELDLLLRGVGGALRGLVLDPDGVPLAGARVRVVSHAEDRGQVDDAGRWLWPALPIELRSSEDGSFFVDGLAPGDTAVAARAQLYSPLSQSVAINPGATSFVELRLRRGGVLEGTIRAADGNPAREATVYVSEYGSFGSHQAPVRADGSFRIDAIASGVHEVRVSSKLDGKATTRTQVLEGQTVRWDVTLEAGTAISGRVVDESGAPLVGWHVAAELNPGLWERRVTTGERGEFELTSVSSRARALAVGPADMLVTGASVRVPLPATPDETVVVTVPASAIPRATLSMTLRTREGAVPPDSLVSLASRADGRHRSAHPDGDGRASIERIVPGSYQLELQVPGCAVHRRTVVLAQEESLDLGVIELSPGGRILAKVRMPSDTADTARADGLQISILDRSGRSLARIDVEGESGLSLALEAGDYLLRSHGSWRTSTDVDVTVVEGETTAVDVDVEPATFAVLELRIEPGSIPPASFTYRVLDGAGRLDRIEEGGFGLSGWTEEGARLFVGGFTPGAWRVEVETDDGRRASADFTIDSLDRPRTAEPQAILELR